MKIAIITSVSLESSNRLAHHLKLNKIDSQVFRPFKDGEKDFRKYDCVFSYGCSADTRHNHRINSRQGVLNCIDKFVTFDAFHVAGVPTVRAWKHKGQVPRDVQSLVIRKDPNGRKAEDMEYWDRDSDVPIPNGGLFSEWYHSRRELRVTVFMGSVWVYRKDLDTNNVHTFNLTTSAIYDNIRKDALKAAKELQIDYVSFDVLYNSKNEYKFLEANSGSIITDEASTAIVEHFLNWK